MAAQQGIYLDLDNKKCVICRGVLKDPVSIPCGHCFCLGCIKGVWDGEDRKQTYSCPQCRQAFTPRPVLVKSTIFVEFMEKFKKIQGAASPPADFCGYAGPEDVACDVCTARKLKALKSCLMCKASYCEKHLRPHYESPLYAQHKLLDPSKKLLENLCFRHTTRTKRVFSGTHQEFVGYLYYVDRHKAPDKVAAERTERQKELEGTRKTIQRKILDKEKGVKVLQQEVVAINGCADKAVEDSEKTFTEMICLFQKKSSDLKQQLRSKQETEVGRVKEIQGKLEKEIADLRRKDAELKTLSVDNSDFLQKKTSLSCLNESPESHSSDCSTSPLGYFEDMTATLSELREKLHGILNKGFPKISPPNANPEMESVSVAPQPETRSEFLQYSCQLTLDPNTVHTHLLLSEGNRKATLVKKDQLYPWHPDRFLERWQALSNEGLTGRCYWEVERSGVEVFIAVAYKDISRTGTFDACAFGNNAKSWGLASYRNGYHFKHGNIKASVTGTWSSRVGVYLDQSAGVLSFYSVSEESNTMTLLHKVQAVFTQPLYAGFRLPNTKGDAVELCSLE